MFYTMKKNLLVWTVLVTVLCTLVGCNPNMPELTESSRQKLIGKWEVEKETVTNGDGFGGVFTREGENLLSHNTYEFTSEQLIFTNIPSLDGVASYATFRRDYTLQQQADGTWLLTVVGLFDKARNLEGGYSPITIHKLTKKSLEWECESYGGDEGPVVYYQYLRRL